MLTFNGHVVHGTAATLVVIFILVFIFAYGLPALYNFWLLFQKAGKPGWAAIIPVYGPVVACQIAKKPIWWGVVFGIAEFQLSGSNNIIYAINVIQLIVLLAIGIPIIRGLARQYKTSRAFWILSVLLPIAASSMVKSVTYKPSK